jgi:hypothetical protein
MASRKDDNSDFLHYNDSDDNAADLSDNGETKKKRGPYKKSRNTKQQKQQQNTSSPSQDIINMESNHAHEAAAASLDGQLQQHHYGHQLPSHHHHHYHNNNYYHHQYMPPPPPSVPPSISSKANSNDAMRTSAKGGLVPSQMLLAPPASMIISGPDATIPVGEQQRHLIYQKLAHVDVDEHNNNDKGKEAIENPFANHIKETISEVWTEMPLRSSTNSCSSLETLRKSRDLSNPLLWTLSSAPMKSLILSTGVTNNVK